MGPWSSKTTLFRREKRVFVTIGTRLPNFRSYRPKKNYGTIDLKDFKEGSRNTRVYRARVFGHLKEATLDFMIREIRLQLKVRHSNQLILFYF